jgi:hypothetical protein
MNLNVESKMWLHCMSGHDGVLLQAINNTDVPKFRRATTLRRVTLGGPKRAPLDVTPFRSGRFCVLAQAEAREFRARRSCRSIKWRALARTEIDSNRHEASKSKHCRQQAVGRAETRSHWPLATSAAPSPAQAMHALLDRSTDRFAADALLALHLTFDKLVEIHHWCGECSMPTR